MEHMLALKTELHAISPYFGWHPYPVYQEQWERERMQQIQTRAAGTNGTLLVALPVEAKFRTDPKRDGDTGKWSAEAFDDQAWLTIKTSTGWQNQGLVEQGKPLIDTHGHPYTGVAWYRFDGVTVPDSAKGKSVWLYCPAVINQAWVYVNGQPAGERKYMQPWFRPQELDIDISKFVKPGEKNQITLKVLCMDENFGANGVYERLFFYAKAPGK
jgi:hypothetical protein